MFSTKVFTQGIEEIIVEIIRVDTTIANIDTNLSSDAVTYRVFADLAENYKLFSVYGTSAHPLHFETNTEFYNTLIYGETFGHNIDTALINTAAPALKYDSYISINSASKDHLGILYEEDSDSSGMVLGSCPLTQQVNINLSTVFGQINYSGSYVINNGYYFVSPEVSGPTSSNRILIGQFTTDGFFSFEINLRIINTITSEEEYYVAANPTGNEKLSLNLNYPPVPGCISPTACNYNPHATYDDGSCIEPILPCYICINDTLGLLDLDNNSVCDALQEPLEDVIVETYYIVDSTENFSDTNLKPGSITYRIYSDLAPGYRLGGVFASSINPVFINTTSYFYNHELGSTIANNIDTALFSEAPELTLDSWISMGNAAGSALDGILKTEDYDGSFIKGLNNNSDILGIPVYEKDGYIEGYEKSVTETGLNLSVFDTLGSEFFSTSGGWLELDSATGPTLSNKILLLQLTTDGALTFNLNLQVRGPQNSIFQYVASNPQNNAIQSDALVFPRPVYGCTDPTACNYNTEATIENGTCIFPVLNCSECFNDTLRIIDSDGDGICNAEEISGCTSITACNYDSLATDDDGSCLEPIDNCTQCVGDTLELIDDDGDGVCNASEIPGCNDPLACNYDSLATEYDGSCVYPTENCTECLGDTLQIIDDDGDGICNADEIPGCTSSIACNYDPRATDDDSSCIIPVENCSYCEGDSLQIIDVDRDGTCDALDPNPLELPFRIDTIINTCLYQDICLPIVAVDTMKNILGFQFELNFDPLKVTPTGSILINSSIEASEYIEYDYLMNIQDGSFEGSVNLRDDTPSDYSINGIGELFCIGFSQTPELNTSDTLLFEMTYFNVIYKNDTFNMPIKPGVYLTTKDYTLYGEIVYWKNNIPITYDSSRPGEYLITNIYSSNEYCNQFPSNVVNPNLYGYFELSVQNNNYFDINRNIASYTDVMPVINGYDAILTLKTLLHDTSFKPNIFQLLAMDVNTDGVVSAGDLSQMNMRAVGSISEFMQSWNYQNGNNTGELSKDWLFLSNTELTNEPAYLISKTFPSDDGTGFSRFRLPEVKRCLEVPEPGDCSFPFQTYTGIMLGDIDGNYINYSPNGSFKNTSAKNRLIINLEDNSKLNSQIRIDLIIEAEELAQSVDIIIDFGSPKIQLDTVFYNNYDLDFINWNLNSEQFGLTMGKLDGFNNTKTLLSMVFNILNNDFFNNTVQVKSAFINGIQVESIVSNIIHSESDFYNTSNIKIYPNPASNKLSIETDGRYFFKLSDITGKIIRSVEIGNESNYSEIDISNIPSGIYIANFLNKKVSFSQKIIINHLNEP